MIIVGNAELQNRASELSSSVSRARAVSAALDLKQRKIAMELRVMQRKLESLSTNKEVLKKLELIEANEHVSEVLINYSTDWIYIKLKPLYVLCQTAKEEVVEAEQKGVVLSTRVSHLFNGGFRQASFLLKTSSGENLEHPTVSGGVPCWGSVKFVEGSDWAFRYGKGERRSSNLWALMCHMWDSWALHDLVECWRLYLSQDVPQGYTAGNSQYRTLLASKERIIGGRREKASEAQKLNAHEQEEKEGSEREVEGGEEAGEAEP